MSQFCQRVENEIKKRRLLLRGQKILAAVSGGADSMVLLHVLNSLAPQYCWNISVAHFNHQLRGRASNADESLVRQTAKRLHLRFSTGRADVKQFAARSKISVEMAARKLRHEFFARAAREHKISVVALAHHADDQVELFFLRLLRGTGGEGLSGMKWSSPSPAGKNITLVRPLLGFSKSAILDFAHAGRIQFREDATNFSTDFLRNRIRNDLLPLLQKKYQAGLPKTVLRLMEIVGDESEFVGAAASRWEHRQPAGRMAAPRRTGFNRQPCAVQRRILQMRLAKLGVVSDFELIEQLRETPGKFISVSSSRAVARDASGRIEWRECSTADFNPTELKLKLTGQRREMEFGGKTFRWQIQPQKIFKVPQKMAGIEIFDADKIGDEIILRHWRAGDRFQPVGLKSPVKLQDLFMNAKIPAARRRNLILATTSRGEIFWVESLRIGGKFKLTPVTKTRLLWRFDNQD